MDGNSGTTSHKMWCDEVVIDQDDPGQSYCPLPHTCPSLPDLDLDDPGLGSKEASGPACGVCGATMPEDDVYCSGCRRVILGTGSYYPLDGI